MNTAISTPSLSRSKMTRRTGWALLITAATTGWLMQFPTSAAANAASAAHTANTTSATLPHAQTMPGSALTDDGSTDDGSTDDGSTEIPKPATAPVIMPAAAATDTAATADSVATASAPASAPAGLLPEEVYKQYVLIPPLLTIVAAMLMRQVIPALALGIFVAAFMLVRLDPAVGGGFANIPSQLLAATQAGVETFLIGAISDSSHIKIILFTLMIGATVGIIAANGGTTAMVHSVTRWAHTRRRGQLAAWFAGLVVFFDDYANAMIIGPAMRPVTDKLGVSRAKLAYIVDSTAAPVASIALIGTWVGAEVGYIQDGLNSIQHRPAFLEGIEAFPAFIASIPYRFYAILALVMVFIIAVLNRDFGPMHKSESEAMANRDSFATISNEAEIASRSGASLAIVPIMVLILSTLYLLIVSGIPEGGIESIKDVQGRSHNMNVVQTILAGADSYNSLLYGAFISLIVAGGMSVFSGRLKLGPMVDSGVEAMCRMFPAIIVLVLAWTLSQAMQDLHLAQVASTELARHQFDPRWLPLLVFISSCIVSFATGTSWGTMSILCPVVVSIAAHLLDKPEIAASDALPIFYASVGSVLAGSVFGDHCSLISDTTVLSSLATECSLAEHVWTQMPYALTVALVSTFCGEFMCREWDLPVWLGLAAGTAMLFLIVLVFGRRPAEPAVQTAA